ncbi:MAG: alpha/beta fold hydrolase [Halolamina sp.]
MPRATNDGCRLHYDSDGAGEPVLFVGDIGFGAWQWGWQHGAVAGPYEAVVADTRGAGRSDAPAGPYRMADLADDAAAVLRDHGSRSAHVVGCGLGGAIALTLARRSERVRSLTLLGTPDCADGYDPEPLRTDPDDPAALSASLTAALSETFVEGHEDAVERMVAWRADEDAALDAWDAQRAALAGFDLRDVLYEVTVPTLVVHGEADALCPPAVGRRLAEGLPRGEFHGVADAGHLVHVEAARPVNDQLLAFLNADHPGR